VNIDLVYSSGNKNNDDLAKLQRGVAAMQQQLYKYGGEVRQFLVDDKGSVLIGMVLLLRVIFFIYFFFFLLSAICVACRILIICRRFRASARIARG
jgi:hypothetical protein